MRYPKGLKYKEGRVIRDCMIDGWRIIVSRRGCIVQLFEAVTGLHIASYTPPEISHEYKLKLVQDSVKYYHQQLVQRSHNIKPRMPYISQEDIDAFKIRLLVEEV
jgi:hypothetical protein